MNKPIIFDGEVTGWEDIEVPAGKYHCIKLHYHEKRGDDVIDEDAWYAEGVGQVKYDGGQYIKELKSYHPNLYETPKPPRGGCHSILLYGQSIRAAPHSMQFS